jgi:hypothetical protein
MPDESKSEMPPPYSYEGFFWRQYGKDVVGWTVKTFWLRVGILLAVPVVLAFEQYRQAHTDWHTIRVTLGIYASVLALYMLGQLYVTGKQLHANLYAKLFKALVEKEEVQKEVDRLSWPDNRPILVFDSWGEVPHDDPRARFHEVTEYRKEREYFERGIFIKNRGGDAHEISVFPIELTTGVKTHGTYIARIDRESTGFAFISMDYAHNVKFSDDVETWELPKIMRQIEDRLNATRVEQLPLVIEVGARYRDANGAWYMSWCNVQYRRENTILFHHANQKSFGTEKPELPASGEQWNSEPT